MGHDITLMNKKGDIISYVRFSAWDFNSKYFYDLFDAQHYNGGVSGYGQTVDYKVSEMRLAYNRYMRIREYSFIYNHDEIEHQTKRRIDKFIKYGIQAAEKDGLVRISYA